MIGLTAEHTDKLWRSTLLDAVGNILRTPQIHRKFATMNGEAAVVALKLAGKLHHDAHPWDDLWQAMAVEHQLRDSWWDERNLLPLLERVKVPAYLGCDWQNVPLHLPSTFKAFAALTNSEHVRAVLLGEYGLTWPWESLHVEALAWYDHWLKGRDTGILEGPPIRYILPGAEGWRTAYSWPPRDVHATSLALCADGSLIKAGGVPGSRTLMSLGAGLNRAQASSIDPPSTLTWETMPLNADLNIVGDVDLQLEAVSTATDTAWIAVLQDVDPAGTVTDVTAGYLRAGLRELDETAGPSAPAIPCRRFQAVVPGEPTQYRVPLVSNARRFRAGHNVRLTLTSDDQDPNVPAIM